MLRSVFTSKFTNIKAIFAFSGEKVEELITLKNMIEENKIKPALYKIFSFNQVAEAHNIVETEQRLGIVVLSLE